MRYFPFFFAHLVIVSAFAANNVVQVPDECLDKEKAPCLVRALEDSFKETSSHLKFYFSQNALVKITQFPGTTVSIKVELLKGQVVIAHPLKVPFYLNTVNVGLNETYYMKKSTTQDLVEVYKSQEAVFFHITKSGGMDLVETKDFASRRSTIDFLEQFENIPGGVFKATLAHYEARLNDEVQNQKRVLQRKIAEDESSRKIDAEARQKQTIENKRIKAMFFMRTFAQ